MKNIILVITFILGFYSVKSQKYAIPAEPSEKSFIYLNHPCVRSHEKIAHYADTLLLSFIPISLINTDDTKISELTKMGLVYPVAYIPNTYFINISGKF